MLTTLLGTVATLAFFTAVGAAVRPRRRPDPEPIKPAPMGQSAREMLEEVQYQRQAEPTFIQEMMAHEPVARVERNIDRLQKLFPMAAVNFHFGYDHYTIDYPTHRSTIRAEDIDFWLEHYRGRTALAERENELLSRSEWALMSADYQTSQRALMAAYNNQVQSMRHYQGIIRPEPSYLICNCTPSRSAFLNPINPSME